MIKQEYLTVSFYVQKFIDFCISFGPRVILGIITLIVGLWIIRKIHKISRIIIERRGFEPTASSFLSDLFDWILKIILFIIVFIILGVQSSSFVALLGAMGLAIGLSLQGSLSNFAGGVLIVIFKPFRVGDYILAQGQEGTVQQIQIFVTKLVTVNNQIIYIPNGILSNGTVINYSESDLRRADLSIGIGYNSDLKKAKNIAFNIMNNHSLVLKDPAPVVWVNNLSESSIILSVRPWAKNTDFWQMRSDILEQIKIEFEKENIEIPFPQRVVHLINNEK